MERLDFRWRTHIASVQHRLLTANLDKEKEIRP